MGLPALRREVVSRNLWHLCGQFTLEALFSKAKPAAVDLARQYVGICIPSATFRSSLKRRGSCVSPESALLACPHVRTGSWPALHCTAGWTAHGSSRPPTMGRGGGGITFSFDPRPISTMSYVFGFRRRTMSWGSRLTWGGRRSTPR